MEGLMWIRDLLYLLVAIAIICIFIYAMIVNPGVLILIPFLVVIALVIIGGIFGKPDYSFH